MRLHAVFTALYDALRPQPPEERVSGGIKERALRQRNIPRDHAPPIDNVIIDAFAPHSVHLVNKGVTPNHLSILGFLFALVALVALYYGHLVWFVVLFGVSYIFDAVDGWTARTYSLYSPWGEALDHWKDIAVGAALILIIAVKRRPPAPLMFGLLVLYGLAVTGEACVQQAIEDRKAKAQVGSDNAIAGMTALCPPGSDPRVMRYLATPTFLAIAGVGLLVYATFRAKS